MTKKKVCLNLLYLCVQKRFREKSRNGIIERKAAFEALSKIYHVPKKFHYPVLREMMFLDLLEFINQKQIKILPCPINLRNTSKIYRELGFYS